MMLEEIEQVDVVLSEDGCTVIFIAYISGDEDHVLIASLDLPIAIETSAFLPDEWRDVRNLKWTLH